MAYKTSRYFAVSRDTTKCITSPNVSLEQSISSGYDVIWNDRSPVTTGYYILSEFDRLGVPCFYDTVELSVLGHYLQSSLSSLYNIVNFVQQPISKSQCREIFDAAAGLSISASRRIFLARNCPEWTHNLV